MSSDFLPDPSSDFLPDVSFTGAFDTNYGDYSGASTLQDTIVGQPGLSLDNSYGSTTGSVFDLGDYNDPILAQSLSGVTDPPIGSSSSSLPSGYAAPQTSSLSTGLSALTKFGSSFAAILGGSSGVTRQVQPSTAVAVPRPGAGSPVSGETTVILVIVVLAVCLLVSRGGD